MSELLADNWAEISRYCHESTLLELRRACSACRDGVHTHVRAMLRPELVDISRWLRRMTMPSWQRRPCNLSDFSAPWSLFKYVTSSNYKRWVRFCQVSGAFKPIASLSLFLALFNLDDTLPEKVTVHGFLSVKPTPVAVDAVLVIYRLLNEPPLLDFFNRFTADAIADNHLWKLALAIRCNPSASRILLIAVSPSIRSRGVELCSWLDLVDDLSTGRPIRMSIIASGHAAVLAWFKQRERKHVELCTMEKMSDEECRRVDHVYILKKGPRWAYPETDPEMDRLVRRARSVHKPQTVFYF